MNINKVVEELKRKYPGKNIVVNNQDGDEEIICEIEPSSDHPEKSLALVIIGKSAPHYHKKSTEIYEAIKGKMVLFIDNQKYLMKKGDKRTIRPNIIHWVETKTECWFYTYSKPGWSFKDHIKVTN